VAEMQTAMREQEARMRKLVKLVTELHEGLVVQPGRSRMAFGGKATLPLKSPRPRVTSDEAGADGATMVVDTLQSPRGPEPASTRDI